MSRMKIGLIGGTGLGELLAKAGAGRQEHWIDTPFGRPSSAIVEGELGGVPVMTLSRHGAGHVINPTQIPVRANIYALKQLGCTHILASGAVGGLREEFKPKDLVVIDQVIDKTYRRANTFYDRSAVHVEFAEPFCPVLRQVVLDAAAAIKSDSPDQPFNVHDRGCYVCMEGPAFSTRAESLMHRLWGGDVIGMTAMPEAKLAREAEISYALVALVTDYDCWRAKPALTGEPGQTTPAADQETLLQEIIGNLQAASESAVALMARAVAMMKEREEALMNAAAQSALRLAIWSDKRGIPAEEIERLRPLWGRYFGG